MEPEFIPANTVPGERRGRGRPRLTVEEHEVRKQGQPTREKIGKAYHWLRRDRGRTLQQEGDRIAVSKEAIRQFEHGIPVLTKKETQQSLLADYCGGDLSQIIKQGKKAALRLWEKKHALEGLGRSVQRLRQAYGWNSQKMVDLLGIAQLHKYTAKEQGGVCFSPEECELLPSIFGYATLEDMKKAAEQVPSKDEIRWAVSILFDAQSPWNEATAEKTGLSAQRINSVMHGVVSAAALGFKTITMLLQAFDCQTTTALVKKANCIAPDITYEQGKTRLKPHFKSGRYVASELKRLNIWRTQKRAKAHMGRKQK